jgi:hypothetical protein
MNNCSLTATILLRTLRSVLHASKDADIQAVAKKINQQTIFDKPTVRQLTLLLVPLCANVHAPIDPVAEALEGIRAMIMKYDSDWTVSRQTGAGIQPVMKECVAVTGTTRGLGSYLLAQLLASDKVEKVWAMNRKSSQGNRERQLASFKDKRLDVELLEGEKLVLLDTNLEDAKLGLQDEVYDEVSEKIVGS